MVVWEGSLSLVGGGAEWGQPHVSRLTSTEEQGTENQKKALGGCAGKEGRRTIMLERGDELTWGG